MPTFYHLYYAFWIYIYIYVCAISFGGCSLRCTLCKCLTFCVFLFVRPFRFTIFHVCKHICRMFAFIHHFLVVLMISSLLYVCVCGAVCRESFFMHTNIHVFDLKIVKITLSYRKRPPAQTTENAAMNKKIATTTKSTPSQRELMWTVQEKKSQ